MYECCRLLAIVITTALNTYSWSIVGVKVCFLNTLTMISLWIGETK